MGGLYSGKNPWMCVYYKYKDIFQNSIGKMMNMDASEIFKNARGGDLEGILTVLLEYERRKKDIERVLEKAEQICPVNKEYSVYFIPAPHNFIITQKTAEEDVFTLYAVTDKTIDEFNKLPVYLSHEYAHVVRLQSVLLPQGISSPYQMDFLSLAIFEGLGVIFSAYFNKDLKKVNLWKYIPVDKGKWKEHLEKEEEYMGVLKKRRKEKITKEVIQEFYGEEKKGYIIGSLLILSLLKN